MPFWMILYKKLKNKFLAIFCKKYVSKNIKIDMEYAMILAKCESMIIWGPISPFIFPLTILSINTNYYFYHKMVNKQNWIIKPFNKNVLFPIYVLWADIVISQILISIFIFVCMDSDIYGWTIITILFVIDTIYAMKYYSFKRNDNKPKESIEASPLLPLSIRQKHLF
eukprot:173960_1